MRRFITIFLTINFSLANVLLFAQEGDKKNDPAGWKKADKLYKEKGYMASAEGYQRKFSAEEMSPEVMSKVANSYRLNGEPELAAYWYGQFIQKSTNVEDKLHYAEVLQSTGKCEDAVRWYESYQQSTGSSKREFLTDCNELAAFKEYENVVLGNAKALNTENLDYSAIAFDGGVMFTSTRGIQKARRMTDAWTKTSFSDVFFAKKKTSESGVSFEEPVPVEGDINQRFHDGATALSSSGTIMFFSRNNSKGKGKNGVIDLKIYSATLLDGAWTNVSELPLNGSDFATCHPSISRDGNWLYFASNRPGGFGGMDIYVSQNKDGVWQKPRNLGATVNSPGNEIFPFINDNGALYFSSNGHKGFGGLDVFKVEKSNLSDESSWTIRENIGKPFNSIKDDFGFSCNSNLTEGYLTSNRDGGMGGDDIYTWNTTDGKGLDTEPKLWSNILITDPETGRGIRDAQVTIEDIYGKTEPESFTTNSRGIVRQELAKGKEYKIKIEKDGYVFEERTVSARDLLDGSNFVVNIEKLKCTELNGVVLNEKYNKALSNTEVTLWNKCTGEKLKVMTRADGSFDFCLEPGCDFEVLTSKESFSGTQTKLSTVGNESSAQPINLKIEMLLKEVSSVATTNTNNSSSTSTSSNTAAEVKEHLLGDANSTFKVGQVITLKNIYYNFNKATIRPDAELELDYIVRMMKEFPDMEINLASHTDARGKSRYNKKLSESRAQSARAYLIKKGIAAGRIKAAGFGELQLKNKCKDGVNCSEEEHQINRRTEVMITKIK